MEKKWHLKEIPKIAHFYWGEEKLPYLRYLTIASFRKYNPDWKIRVYYPKYRQLKKTWNSKEHKYKVIVEKDYWEELKNLRITFVEVDFKSLDLSNDLSEVHKSDYLRWFLLANIGGLWSDMDIIYIDSMINMEINSEKNMHMNTLLCYHWLRENSIGFILSSLDNAYFKSIWEQSQKWKYDSTLYQTVGSRLMNRFPKSPEQIKDKFPKLEIGNMSMDTVYPYNSNMIPILHADKLNLLSKNTIGVHWYAGHIHSGEFVNKITEKNYGKINNAVAKIVDISLNNKKEKALKDINSSNFPKKPKKRTLTIQSVVKNEAFIYYSIKSIYPYADKILLYDTGSNDKHTLEDIQKLIEEDVDKKIVFKQIPLGFDEEKWSLKNLKAFIKEHKGKMSVGKVRQMQIEDTDTEFFMIVDGDEVHYKATMEKIVNEILPKLSDNIVGVNIPLIWFCDMQHAFAVNCTGRIWRTDKVCMNDESPNEAHCYKSTGITVKGADKEYLIYKDICPYAHFETYLKPWRRTPTKRRLYKGALPEVMEENPYYIQRYLNEHPTDIPIESVKEISNSSNIGNIIKKFVYEVFITKSEKEIFPIVKPIREIVPKASVIIPSFKRSELLRWGLYSLAKQKSDYPFEVIVLNDGIEDDTEKVCDEYKDKLNIKYIFTGQRNKEKIFWRIPGFAINIGIKQAKGEVIIITCPEIFIIDNCITQMIDPILKNPKLITITDGKFDGKYKVKNEAIFLKYIEKNKGIIDKYMPYNKIPQLQVCLPFFMGIAKKELIEIGGYDEDFVGYCFDDNDIVDRLKYNGCSYHRLKARIVHLWHLRHKFNSPEINKLWNYNKNLYEKRKKLIKRNIGKEWGKLDVVSE